MVVLQRLVEPAHDPSSDNVVDGGARGDGEPLLSELFHENSKQQRHDVAFGQRIAAINASPDIHRIIARAYKVYAGAACVSLPAITPGEGLSFERAVVQRRSVRDFTGEPLSLEDLAKLLFLGNGITGRQLPDAYEVDQPLRAAPSAGALYAVELYAVVRAVDQLPAALWHYEVPRHILAQVRPGDFMASLAEATAYPSIFANASATILLSVIFGRTRFKYGERGYRFALLETGHIAQNILLTATALNLGAVAIGGFIDDEVNDLVGLDGVDEAAVYVIPIGRPAPASRPHGSEVQTAVDGLLSMFWEMRSQNEAP